MREKELVRKEKEGRIAGAMFFRRKEGRELAYKGRTWLDRNMAGDTQ